jgi:hypothetical protein
LTKIIEKILTKHNIQVHILIITIDNVSNNIIFFLIFVKNLNIITSCVNVIFEKKNEEDDEMSNKKKVKYRACIMLCVRVAIDITDIFRFDKN